MFSSCVYTLTLLHFILKCHFGKGKALNIFSPGFVLSMFHTAATGHGSFFTCRGGKNPLTPTPPETLFPHKARRRAGYPRGRKNPCHRLGFRCFFSTGRGEPPPNGPRVAAGRAPPRPRGRARPAKRGRKPPRGPLLGDAGIASTFPGR